jgi:hypothetical protein
MSSIPNAPGELIYNAQRRPRQGSAEAVRLQGRGLVLLTVDIASLKEVGVVAAEQMKSIGLNVHRGAGLAGPPHDATTGTRTHVQQRLRNSAIARRSSTSAWCPGPTTGRFTRKIGDGGSLGAAAGGGSPAEQVRPGGRSGG